MFLYRADRSNFGGRFRQCIAVCLAIVAALGALFGLALLATAITGDSTPSSILLGGIGFILLLLSALVFVFAYRQWTAHTPGEGCYGTRNVPMK